MLTRVLLPLIQKSLRDIALWSSVDAVGYLWGHHMQPAILW